MTDSNGCVTAAPSPSDQQLGVTQNDLVPTVCPSISAAPLSEPVTFSVATDFGGLLSKRVSIDETGQPQIDASGCAMARGWVHWVTLPHLSALAPLLYSLSSANALMLGVTETDSANIVTKNALPWNPGHIARTKEFFDWPDHGAIAMIDHDPNDSGPKVRDAMCVDRTKKHNLEQAQLVERRVLAHPEWYARDKYREVVMSLQGGRG